jgi:hypothetical protein
VSKGSSSSSSSKAGGMESMDGVVVADGWVRCEC